MSRVGLRKRKLRSRVRGLTKLPHRPAPAQNGTSSSQPARVTCLLQILQALYHPHSKLETSRWLPRLFTWPSLAHKHESWQNSSVMGCTTWREGGSYLLRNISSVYPCTSKGLDVPWESLALAESQQVCWERSAGADSQTRNTQTSPPHTHTSHLMHACAHIPPTPDSHLIKFLISFSAHVFTIFLGLPLQ